MNEQVQKEIFTRLDAIAAKLGVAAAHLWEILVRQAKLEGIANICLCVLLIVVAIVAFVAAQKSRKRADKNNYEDGYYGVVAACYVASVAVTVFSLFCLYDGVLRLMNPEFYAFQQLLQLVK